MPNFRSLEFLRRRVCTIIDIGTADDLISRAYDIFYTLVILVNLVVTIAYTFDEQRPPAVRCCCGLKLPPWPFSPWTASCGSGLPSTIIPI